MAVAGGGMSVGGAGVGRIKRGVERGIAVMSCTGTSVVGTIKMISVGISLVNEGVGVRVMVAVCGGGVIDVVMVNEGVSVGEGVSVSVIVADGVNVAVDVSVRVGVSVMVDEGVIVGVSDGVNVADGVGDCT
jgi:hypothetical protein